MDPRQPDWVAIDFETTGSIAGYPNEPWQIGLIPIRGGAPVAAEAFESFLRVGPRPFSRHAPGIHAAVRDELAHAPTLQDLLPHIRRHCRGRPLVAHNAATEQAVFRRTLPLERFGPWIDTLRLARRAYPDLPAHGLESLLDHLGLLSEVHALLPGRHPHDALFDAAGSAVFLTHLLRAPAWADLPLQALISA